MFGHVIALNFNKKGESHNTVIGGIFSVITKIMFTVYCYMQFEKLITYGQNSLVTTILKIDLDKFGPVELKTSNYYSFHVFKKQTVLGGTLKMDKNFFKNLDIFYQERTIDWYKKPGEQLNKRWYPARECVVDDFGEHGKPIFDTWKGFTLACPDIPKDDIIKLEGDPGTMVATSFDFIINRCNSSNPLLEGEACNDPKVTSEWVKDVQVDAWGYSNTINFDLYETRPVFRS